MTFSAGHDMKSMLPRCFFVPAVVLALLAAAPLVQADDTAPAKDKPLSKAKEQFDTDKDGKLSDAEKAAMKEEARQKREEKKKTELAKYDANHNGKLEPEEKEKMKADIEAAREDAPIRRSTRSGKHKT